jgi:hypothetical protein
VVDATPAEHWRLSVGLGVTNDFEDVEHRGRPDLDEGEPHIRLHRIVEHGHVENVPVKGAVCLSSKG